MPTADDNPTQPLLGQEDGPSSATRGDGDDGQISPYQQRRGKARDLLSSKKKHYLIMSLVALDVASILSDVFIALVVCDLNEEDEPWVGEAREGLKLAGLIFSSLFLVELLLSIWAFGFVGFFSSWFHCFDGLIILVSFVFDILAHGILEEIGSLVIILRLVRFVKIVEELSVGASERMEDIEARMEVLEKENADLRDRVQALKGQRTPQPDSGL